MSELIVILFLACIPGQSCAEKRIPFGMEPNSQMICNRMGAQQTLAEWQAAHPAEHVTKWRCVPASRAGHDI